ncbi:hypothetical protein [Candidatus Aalborgicola defluviihabitans]|uniref:hypothetical protein n=1 Tax=Candidatus Aalborgicola defluviihabitans TaxID=3386187 RepID=UPI0039B84622
MARVSSMSAPMNPPIYKQITRHRLENPSLLSLAMIEVQSGQYLGVDDIVHLQNYYGRVV